MLNFNQMKNEGEFLLIQTDDSFIAPDGVKYDAVWGKCKVLSEKELLGLIPSRASDWYMQVGNSNKSMLISGSRIHYVHVCLEAPKGRSIYKIHS